MASQRNYNDLSIRDLIRQVLKNGGMEKKLDEMDTIQCYHDLMGSFISGKTREIYLRDKTLVIRMDSGVLKEELSYGKERIRELINEKMGKTVVEEVQVW